MAEHHPPRYLKATLVTTAAAVSLVIAFFTAMAVLSSSDPEDPFDAPGAAGGLLVLLILLAMVTVMAAAILPWSARGLHKTGRLQRGAFVRRAAALTALASLGLVLAMVVFLKVMFEPIPVLMLLALHLAFMLPLSWLWFAVATRQGR